MTASQSSQTEPTGTPEVEPASIPTTEPLGTSWARIIGLGDETLPEEFYEFANRNERSWREYCSLDDLTALAHENGLIITPSNGKPRAMMLTRVHQYPGLRQLTVVWTGGSVEQEDVHSLVEAAKLYAQTLDCKRIMVDACPLLLKQVKAEGFRPWAVQMIKDL